MTARLCSCGRKLTNPSPYVTQCGRCSKARIDAARAERHVYQRTHVHIDADGARSIRLGLTCEGDCA